MSSQERYGLPEEVLLSVKVDAETAANIYWECNPVWDGSDEDGSGRTTAVNHVMDQLKTQIGNISQLPKEVGERAKLLYPEPLFNFDAAIPHGWANKLYEESGPYEYDFRGTGSFVWVYEQAYDDEGNRISGSTIWGRPGPITPEALDVCIESSFNEMSDSLERRHTHRKHFKALSNWEYRGCFSAIQDMKETWDRSVGLGFTSSMKVHVNQGRHHG